MVNVVWAVWNPWPKRPSHPRIHGRAGRLRAHGIRVEVVELGPWAALERRLAATLDAMDADVLVADASPFPIAIAARTASRRVGVPYVLWQDEPWAMGKGNGEGQGELLSGAAAVVVPCESQRAPVLEATDGQAACHAIRAAVEPAIASAVTRASGALGQAPVILHTARLHDGRVDRLLRLAAKLRREDAGARLHVVARASDDARQIERLRARALEDELPLVALEPSPSELTTLLDRAELVVWPSDNVAWDGDPGPALDALCRGTPVAVEGHGELSNAILRAGAGVSFDLGDPVWSACQLASGVRDPGMRTAGRRAARKLATSDEWQPGAQATSIATLLERVVIRRRRKSA